MGALSQTPVFQANPLFTQLVGLFQNYALIHQLVTCIIILLVPIKASEAVDPPLSIAGSTILGMLMDRGLHRAMEDLPRAELGPVLHTVLLLLLEAQ